MQSNTARSETSIVTTVARVAGKEILYSGLRLAVGCAFAYLFGGPSAPLAYAQAAIGISGTRSWQGRLSD